MLKPVSGASITVVIPTYNRIQQLPRALASISAQTCPGGAHTIVVDDGSTDGSGSLVSRQFPNVQLLGQPNRGVSAARNAGMAAAQTDWIAFIDSDDEWLPHKLQVQFNALKAHPEYRIVHSEEIWIRNGRQVNVPRIYQKKGGWIFRECLPVCAISPSSVIIHREVLDTVGVFDESLPACEDYDLWLRLSPVFPVLLCPEPLIRKYGGHADQLSNQPGLDRYRIRALQKALENGDLAPHYRDAATRTLKKKCAIYAAGARKRGRLAEAERYEALAANPEISQGSGL